MKVQCLAVPTFGARGDLSRYAHTKGNRAGDIPHVKEYGLNIKMFELFDNYEQMKQPKERRQPFSRLSEEESHTKLLLEEQRKQIVSETRSGDEHAGVKDRK